MTTNATTPKNNTKVQFMAKLTGSFFLLVFPIKKDTPYTKASKAIKFNIRNLLIDKRTSLRANDAQSVVLVDPRTVCSEVRTYCVERPATIGILNRNTGLCSNTLNGYTIISTSESENGSKHNTCDYKRTYKLFHLSLFIKPLIIELSEALGSALRAALAFARTFAFWALVTQDTMRTTCSIWFSIINNLSFNVHGYGYGVKDLSTY